MIFAVSIPVVPVIFKVLKLETILFAGLAAFPNIALPIILRFLPPPFKFPKVVIVEPVKPTSTPRLTLPL